MDIEKAIRLDALSTLLGKVALEANAIGASPEEVIAALHEKASAIYSVELSGARGPKHRKRAALAYIRGMEIAMRDLPTIAVDKAVEAELKRRGL